MQVRPAVMRLGRGRSLEWNVGAGERGGARVEVDGNFEAFPEGRELQVQAINMSVKSSKRKSIGYSYRYLHQAELLWLKPFG